MAIQAIECRGYYENQDQKIVSQRFEKEPVLIQEIGEQIHVLCSRCVNGICDTELSGTDHKGANKTRCIFLKNERK